VVECVAELPVPVTVSGYVPAAAVPALTVSVELEPAVTEVGFRLAVAPLGTPLTLRLTVWAEPEVTAVLIVELPVLPSVRLRELGVTLIEKSLEEGGPKAAVPLGVPRPVGPSYPGPAVHR
jgi:hypothetical protein